MSLSVSSPIPALVERPAVIPFLPAIAFLFASLLIVSLSGESHLRAFVEDDAYYYLVIAQNIAETGRSEFTPGIATNGYHPLWMIVLVAAGSLFGFSIATLKVLETVAVFSGMVALVGMFRIRSLTTALFATFALWYVVRSFALNGMETSLLVPLIVVFTALVTMEESAPQRWRTVLLFLAGASVVGTRLDAAFFVMPMLAVAPVSLNSKLRIVGGLALCGLAYVGINHVIFGTALPVSGAVKSLGGLQYNLHYLESFVTDVGPTRLMGLLPASIPFILAVAVIMVALLARRFQALPWQVVPVLGAACVGLLLYGSKLAFFSSWQIWPWYNFPSLIFFLLGLSITLAALPATRVIRLAEIIVGIAFVGYFLHFNLEQRSAGFADLNRAYLREHASLLLGETVAMADRAGSFAADYDGPVYQIEGLVNSRGYVDVLRQGGDLRRHLCERGVTFLVDYEVPLGDYGIHTIKILRPYLTSYEGPTITVFRSEQVASFQDLSIFDNSDGDEGDSRIYMWRLNCLRI